MQGLPNLLAYSHFLCGADETKVPWKLHPHPAFPFPGPGPQERTDRSISVSILLKKQGPGVRRGVLLATPGRGGNEAIFAGGGLGSLSERRAHESATYQAFQRKEAVWL